MKARHLLILLLGLSACVDHGDDFGPQSELPTGPAVASSVYIVNEGNFQRGNASVTAYDPVQQQVYGQIFQQSNGIPLGDVAQSMYIRNDTAHLVVNNSGKIRTMLLPGFQQVGETEGLTSPRYLTPLNGTQALVTDLYADQVWIWDMHTHQSTGTIPLPGWCEELVSTEQYIFGLHQESHHVVVFPRNAPTQVDSFLLGTKAQRIVATGDGHLWVLTEQALVWVDGADPNQRAVHVTWNEPIEATRAAYDPSGRAFYFLDSSVWKIDLTASVPTPEEFLSGDGHNWYGLAVEPASGEVYVTDARDYQSAGTVHRYAASGQEIDRFEAGVIPQHIAFYAP